MAFNKADYYGDSLGILESQVGLVQKTATGTQDLATEIDGKKVIQAGTLFSDAEDKYAEVTPEEGANPKASGWYTKSGGTYTAATDTTVQGGTTYYEKTHSASGMLGVVFQDYDMTDYPEGYPISVVVQGRLKADRVASEVTANKSDLAAQGLYLISY